MKLDNYEVGWKFDYTANCCMCGKSATRDGAADYETGTYSQCAYPSMGVDLDDFIEELETEGWVCRESDDAMICQECVKKLE